MVFIIPKNYKCPKCDFKTEYSPSYNYSFLPVYEGKPICPMCLIKFITENVPIMEKED